ncbi:MAG: LOG family protein, partial [Candidatus Latescibacterota bacterium]
MKKSVSSSRRPRKARARRPAAHRKEPLPQTVLQVPPDDPEAEQRVKRLMRSQSFLRADLDTAFLQKNELRPTRLLLEYLKPELGLQEAGVESAIVIFGGTRIMEPAVAKRQLMKARAALKKHPKDPGLKRSVATAKRMTASAPYYDIAREFARIASSTLEIAGEKGFAIITGGGPGIMEAANRGAFDNKAKSVGLSIALPHEQYPNPYITPGLCFEFRYFALRKMHFLRRAKALVAFPGGFGTLDELFVTLTL